MKTAYLFILFTLFSYFSFGQTRNIEVTYKQNDDKTVDFYYTKNTYGTYTVKITFLRLENAFNENIIATAKGKSGKLFTLRPIDSKKGISFSYKYSYTLGENNPKINKSFVYVLPFKKGTKVKVGLASYVYKTYFNKENPENWTAYVFKSSNLDTVTAIRKGLVIDVKDSYEFDSISDFTSNKNLITIEHQDGTFATYKGFAKKGIFVAPGQTVYPHTALGILSNPTQKQNHNLSLIIYYLNDDFNNEKAASKLVYVKPLFFSNEGTEHLIQQKNYTTSITDEILFEEMSKRERKKYLGPIK